jgi:hypothetical protein
MNKNYIPHILPLSSSPHFTNSKRNKLGTEKLDRNIYLGRGYRDQESWSLKNSRIRPGSFNPYN